jgi:hypothetical protein
MDTADLAQEAYERAIANSNVKKTKRTDKKVTANLESLGGILSPEALMSAKAEGADGFMNVVRPEIEALLSEPPVPFVEPEGEKPYIRDILDGMLPKPGFITDFVNTGRGMESPTLFFVWNSLWLLSTILKREAWLQWYPNKLWPNLYVLLVAPPALCRKSSSMVIANELLRALPQCLPSTVEAYAKTSQVITGKTTPEGLLNSLAPDQKVFLSQKNGSQSMITVDKGSQIALSISELAVFLGKQQYNSGMVTLLTDLFDCKDKDSEITRGNGLKPLKDIYITLFGAITPDGMKSSIPEEAFGGGFMSRVVIAYQDTPTKIYPIPKPVPGYPVWQDLTFRLAWIAKHAKGEYYLTSEAEDYYARWYRAWKASLFSVPDNQNKDNRIDSLILRVALLMRVQEYREGNDITLENIQDARKLLEYTSRTGEHALENVGATAYGQSYNTIKRFIIKRGACTRRELSQYMSSRGIKADEITSVIDQLTVEGVISISTGTTPSLMLDRSINSGKEVYSVIGSEAENG